MIDSFQRKAQKNRLVGLAVYDYLSARIAQSVGVDFLLVGDSLGMNVFGYDSTRLVTLDDMIRHTDAVLRGAPESLVVIDLPHGSYDTVDIARNSVQRVQSELGLKTVKVEGRPDIVSALIEDGFDVMGHTGLKPQTAEKLALVGKGESAQQVIDEAQALEKAGVFSLILECIPESLGQQITDALSIPTIGIGAGIHCSGQILVLQDLIGLAPIKKPKFVKQYVDLQPQISQAIKDFKNDVENATFPGPEEVYS